MIFETLFDLILPRLALERRCSPYVGVLGSGFGLGAALVVGTLPSLSFSSVAW